jgi:hypothetical protein
MSYVKSGAKKISSVRAVSTDLHRLGRVHYRYLCNEAENNLPCHLVQSVSQI